MAVENTNLTYTDLIGRVISDYNNIEDSLIDKFLNTAAAFTQGSISTDAYSGKIDLLTYIDGNFASTGTEGGVVRPNSITGKLSGSESLSTGAIEIDDDGNYIVTSNLTAAKYLTTGVSLVTTIDNNYIKPLEVTGAISKATYAYVTLADDDSSYTFTPNGYIIKNVKISKATHNVAPTKDGQNETGLGFSGTLSSVLSLAKNSEDEVDTTKTTVNILNATDASKTSDFKITIDNYAQLTNGKITANGLVTVNAGYTEGIEENIEWERDLAQKTSTDNDPFVLYLPEGQVDIFSYNEEGSTNNPKASITSDLDIFTESTNKDEYIELNASVDEITNVRAKFTEGYYVPKTTDDYEEKGEAVENARITVEGSKKKLKKGKISWGVVDNKELTALAVKPSFSAISSDIISTTTNDANVISVEISTSSSNIDFTSNIREGYLTTEEINSKANVKLESNEATLKIKKAVGLVAKSGITGYTPVDNDGITTTDTDDVYTVTITPNLSDPALDLDSTNADARLGYVSSLDSITSEITTDDAKKSYTIKIPQAKVSASAPTISISSINDANPTGNSGTVSEFTNILKTTLSDAEKAAGDYLELTATPGFSLSTEGFIKGDDIRSLSNGTAYIPKATFSWIKLKDADGNETDEEALEVTTAGYVPSGFITDISSIEGIGGYNASVMMNLSSSNITLVPYSESLNTEDYYNLSISAQSIDAGYISNGNVADVLSNTEFCIQKAVINPTVTLDLASHAYQSTEITWDADNKKYTFEVKPTVTASLGTGAKEGYLEALPNAQTLVYDGSEGNESPITMSLPTASFAKSTHTTNIEYKIDENSTLLGVIDDTKTSAYYVTPKITSCSVALEISNAGYISNSNSDRLNFSDSTTDTSGITLEHGGTHEAVYFKAGVASEASITTVAGASNITTEDISSDGLITSTTSTQKYTVNVTGKFNGNINIGTGLYTSTEVNALSSVNKEISLPTGVSFDIKKGSVTPSVAIAPNGAVAFTSNFTDTVANIGENVKLSYTKEEKDNIGDNSKFVKVESKGTVATTTTVTEGYVKENEHTEDDLEVSGATYIRLFETESKDYSDNTTYGFDVGNKKETGVEERTLSVLESVNAELNTVTVPTAGKFLSKDVVVTVNADAMGDNVLTQLLHLQNRLSGVRQ